MEVSVAEEAGMCSPSMPIERPAAYGPDDQKDYVDMDTSSQEAEDNTNNQTISEKDQLRFRILDQVAASNAFFKSQQRGEKDLAFEDKWNIASEILDNNVGVFLQRYAKFIAPEDLEYFESYKHNYEVAFYLKENRRFHDKRKNRVRIRNRRYGALQKLIKEGKYFSEEEMKMRNPMLYEQMVGQFLTEEEKKMALEKELSEMTFSGFLITQMTKDETYRKCQQQMDEEDSMWEEGESDDEEDEIEQTDVPSLSEPEKNRLKSEFVNIMYESFLSGKDKDFDYSIVDNNADYDPLDMEQQDEEEKYFDSEEPEDAESFDLSDMT